MDRVRYTPAPPLHQHNWQTDELAKEVRYTLDEIEAPPIDEHVMFTFQKVLYRGRQFNYEAVARSSLRVGAFWNRKAIKAPSSNRSSARFATPVVSSLSMDSDSSKHLTRSISWASWKRCGSSIISS